VHFGSLHTFIKTNLLHNIRYIKIVETTATCFGKNIPSFGSTRAKVKTSYKWYTNICKV
jgi:hypothetical protein